MKKQDKFLAAISADIVSSSTLKPCDVVVLSAGVSKLLSQLIDLYKDNNTTNYFSAKIVKGDGIEIVLNNSQDALKIALILKTAIRAYALNMQEPPILFAKYGVRLAIGVLKNIDIYDNKEILYNKVLSLAENELDNLKILKKTKNLNQRTMFFVSDNDFITLNFSCIFALLDNIISKVTLLQCRILKYALFDISNQDISTLLNIKLQEVENYLSEIEWQAIKETICYYEKYFQ